MEQVYERLTERARLLRRKATDESGGQPTRILVALAGPPGSGKSTIAAEVVKRLNLELPAGGFAAILPMDGFHLTRKTLDSMPNRDEAYARRGVAWTFDAEGVVGLIKTLHESRDDLTIIHAAPTFDHAMKDPVQSGILIESHMEFVIIEGNWVLYDEEPWSTIKTLVDDTWFVDVDPALALQRVAARHIKSGIENNWESALERARTNDMLNGEIIRKKLLAPAICVESINDGSYGQC